MGTPLSVDDLLKRQKEEQAAAAKPKFLSKAERQKLALAKREEEAREQRAKEEEERAERRRFEAEAEAERRRQASERYGAGRDGRDGRDSRDSRDPWDRHHDRNGGLDYREHRDRDRDYDRRGGHGRDDRDRPPEKKGRRDDKSNGSAASKDVDELEVIKKRYLGQQEVVKKPWMRKSTNKNAIFQWDEKDDTSSRPLWTADPAALSVPGTPGSSGSGARGSPAPGNSKFTDALERRRAGKGGNDDRHWSEKPLGDMKERDWRIFREDYNISSRGGNIPLPLRSWRESAIPGPILDVVDQIGYTEPSPIQRQAIPIGLQNRDLVGIAKTGSGKTAAFLIPMLTYISHLPPLTEDNRHLGPYALILAPTRELAQQIEAEAEKFARKLGYICVSIVGGRSVEEQQFNLRNGSHIIIATPGRFKDMIDKSMIVLSQCRYIVMDEADRMVDIGFEHDLTFILDAMPKAYEKKDDASAAAPANGNQVGFTGERVTTLFSATMPPAVERLTRKYLRKPATVTIGTAGEAVDTVEQRVEFVHGGEEKKKARFIDLLRNTDLPPPIIVFVNQKATADVVAKYVQQAGFSVTTLHSGKNQEQREAALGALREGHVDVLVATDLAGRGIDVPDVSMVVNWQMSDTIEKYIHRIGRTGRAGKSGLAHTFLDNNDAEVLYDLRLEIEKSKKSSMNQELARHEAARQRITKEMKRKRDDLD